MYRKNTPIGYTKLRFFGIGKGFDSRPSAHDRTRPARPTHDRMHERALDPAFQRPRPVHDSHDPRGRTQLARPT